MTLTLHGHPFSSYCQKVTIALYEGDVSFNFTLVDFANADSTRAFADLWPLAKMPVLVVKEASGGQSVIAESSIIIEYLASMQPDARGLLPLDAQAALDVRFMDRVFDNYVMTPMARIVFDFIRPVDKRDAFGVTEARTQLDRAYKWLDHRMASRTHACGGAFTLADCAAAPALLYADWVHPINPAYNSLTDYRRRLLARSSVARAVDEGRAYRHFFPPGAPDRD